MTLSQGQDDNQRGAGATNRGPSERSPVTICGRAIHLNLHKDVISYIPKTITVASCVTDEVISDIVMGSSSLDSESLRQSIETFLSISLAIQKGSLETGRLFELHCAAESFASLAAPEFSRGTRPIQDLAAGYLVAVLIADELGSGCHCDTEGQILRDVFKGHVIAQVKGQAFEGSVPDGFENLVRGKLIDCATSNPHLSRQISALLGDWETLAISAPDATSNLAHEFFAMGEGAAWITDHRLMEDELETEERALIPKAVEIVSSPENKGNWDDSIGAIQRILEGKRNAQIALNFNERRIDSFSFSQYVLALFDTLRERNFTKLVFAEEHLVPPSVIASLQRNKDDRSLQTIANLTAEYLNLPPLANVASLRSYLGINDIDLDNHGTAWVGLIETLRGKTRERRLSVYTVEQNQLIDESLSESTAWIMSSIRAGFENAPLIKISIARSTPIGIGLNSLMHQAVSAACRRDGVGELMSVGVDQAHINQVYHLTELSSHLDPKFGEHYRLASCADIDLWVFIAADDDVPELAEDPIDIDVDVPLPTLL